MPRPSADSANRPAALLVCPEPPYPAQGGGALRSASIIEYLARKYDLDLILFREPGFADPRRALPPRLVRGADVITIPYHSRGATARYTRNARRLARGRPPLLDRYSRFAGVLAGILRGRAYDLAV